MVLGIEDKTDGFYEVLPKPGKKSLKNDHESLFQSELNMIPLWYARMNSASSNIIQRTIPLVLGINLNLCRIDEMCEIGKKTSLIARVGFLAQKNQTAQQIN